MKWRLYRLIMRLAHHYHWHYAPPIYPDGDTQLWCRWCGFRQTIKRGERHGRPDTICVSSRYEHIGD